MLSVVATADAALTCRPKTCAPVACAPATCAPAVCEPATCGPKRCGLLTRLRSRRAATCAPATCEPATCAPAPCEPVTCAPATCGPKRCGLLSRLRSRRAQSSRGHAARGGVVLHRHHRASSLVDEHPHGDLLFHGWRARGAPPRSARRWHRSEAVALGRSGGCCDGLGRDLAVAQQRVRALSGKPGAQKSQPRLNWVTWVLVR